MFWDGYKVFSLTSRTHHEPLMKPKAKSLTLNYSARAYLNFPMDDTATLMILHFEMYLHA